MAKRQSASDIKDQHFRLNTEVTGTDQAAQKLSDLEQSTAKVARSSEILNLTYGEVQQQLYETRRELGQLQNLQNISEEQLSRRNQLYREQIVLTERSKTLQKQLITQELAGSEEAIRSAARESQAQRRLLENLGSRARLYGDIESRSRAVISAGTAIGGGGGAVGQAAMAGTDILGAVEGVKLLRLEFPQLIKNMELTRGKMITLAGGIGAVGVVAGALYLTYKNVNEAMARQRDLAERVINKTESMFNVMVEAQGKTSDEIQKTINDLDAEIRLRQNAIRVNKQNLESAKSAQGTMDQIFDRFGDSDVDKFQEELDKLIEEQQKAIVTQTSYRTALGTTVVATNDAAAAEEKLAEEREEAFRKQENIMISWIEAQGEQESRLMEAREANKLSLDEYFDKLKELNEQQHLINYQIALLESAYAQGAVSQEVYYDKLAQLNEELWSGQDVIDAYKENFSIFSKILEANIEVLKELPVIDSVKGGLKSAFEFGKEAVQASRDAFDQFLEDWQEFVIDWQRAEEDFQIARERDLEDHYIKLAQIDEKFAEQMNKLEEDKRDFEKKERDKDRDELRDFLKKERRALEDHRDRLLEIRERMNASIREASAKLDAFGIWQAKQRAAEEERQEKREYEKQKRRRREDFLDRQRERRRERRERLNDFNQKMQDLRAAHQKERTEAIRQFNRQQQIELENFNLRMSRMQEDFIRQQNLVNQEFENRYGIELYWWDQLNLLASSSMETFVNNVNAGLTSVSPTIGPTTPEGVGVLPAFDRGGVLKRGYGVVGERSAELIRSLSPVSVTPLNRAPANMRMGGITNNFNNTSNFSHKYLEIVATKAATAVVKRMIG